MTLKTVYLTPFFCKILRMLRAIFKFPRLSLALVFIVTFPLLRFAWNKAVLRNHERMMERCRNAGYNALPPDDEQDMEVRKHFDNLHKIAWELNFAHDSSTLFHFSNLQIPATSENWMSQAREFEDRFAPLFNETHAACLKPLGRNSQEPYQLLNNLPDSIGISAIYNLRLGEPERALDRILDALRFYKFYVPGYFRDFSYIRTNALHKLNILTLLLSDENVRILRPRIESLIDELLAESAGFYKHGKWIPSIEFFYIAPEDDAHKQGYFLTPYMQCEADRKLLDSLRFQDALLSPNIPVFLGEIPRLSNTFTVMELIRVNWKENIMDMMRYKAFSNATAVHLACRLYQLDHGQLPDLLVDLVPLYLHQIPLDASISKPTPIEYKILDDPQIGKRPVLIFNNSAHYDHGPAPYNRSSWVFESLDRQYIDLVWNPVLENAE